MDERHFFETTRLAKMITKDGSTISAFMIVKERPSKRFVIKQKPVHDAQWFQLIVSKIGVLITLKCT